MTNFCPSNLAKQPLAVARTAVNRSVSHKPATARHTPHAVTPALRARSTQHLAASPLVSLPFPIRSRNPCRKLQPAQVTVLQASDLDTEARPAPEAAAERAEPAEASSPAETSEEASTSAEPTRPPSSRNQFKGGKRQEFEKSWRRGGGAPRSFPNNHSRERRNPTGPPQRGLGKSIPPQNSEPVTDVWFKQHDVVAGRIVWANEKGARISLLKEPRILGYMPAKQGPYLTRNSLDAVGKWGDPEEGSGPCLPIGLVRDFMVMNVPQDMSYESKGPLLSAQALDLDTLWARAVQMVEVCYEDKENFQLKIESTNQGGLIGMLESLQAFIPYSHVPKEREAWFSDEELAEMYMGKTVEATMTEVRQDFRRVVMSMTIAQHNRAVRSIKLGSLVWGEVRKINDFGCFVGLSGTKISGLLHISNISRAHVERVEDVFQEGDRIRAIVVGMDDGYARISLSTAELEEQEGDMIVNQAAVYEDANAERAAEDYARRLAAVNDDSYDGDYYSNGRSGGGPTDTLDWAS